MFQCYTNKSRCWLLTLAFAPTEEEVRVFVFAVSFRRYRPETWPGNHAVTWPASKTNGSEQKVEFSPGTLALLAFHTIDIETLSLLEVPSFFFSVLIRRPAGQHALSQWSMECFTRSSQTSTLCRPDDVMAFYVTGVKFITYNTARTPLSISQSFPPTFNDERVHWLLWRLWARKAHPHIFCTPNLFNDSSTSWTIPLQLIAPLISAYIRCRWCEENRMVLVNALRAGLLVLKFNF